MPNEMSKRPYEIVMLWIAITFQNSRSHEDGINNDYTVNRNKNKLRSIFTVHFLTLRVKIGARLAPRWRRKIMMMADNTMPTIKAVTADDTA